ncbi:MAG: PKD domain-containing protein [Gammaproteobacteria bacterium]|nr:PKD domain-containing protein [Gammaproteobacteria bacterium]
MEIVNSSCRSVLILVMFGIGLLIPGQAMAIPSGISGYSGMSGSDCTSCHGGTATSPTVTLTADSNTTTVSPGSTTSYTLTMTGGPASNSGLDVAASAGTIIDTNANGTRILNGELTMSSPNPVSGNSISWTFDWQAPNASGTYTIYAATLSGNGNGGTSGDGTGTTSLQITVAAPSNQPPTAMISGPTTGIDGVAVTFDGSGSSDSDGSIVSYDWDLGDGSADAGMSVTHTYAGGSYTITLTVTDDSGNTDTATLTINVSVPNVPPVAEIAGPTNGTEGVAVSFDGSASNDPDGNVVAYDWDFGDNSAGSGATVSHIYAAGMYTVTLMVTDDMGATDSATLNIDIAATTEPQAPIADAGGPYTAEVGVAVQFDGSASTDPDGMITSYSWDFGDGTAFGSGVGPVHIYTASGNYTVELTVTDDQGQTGAAQSTAEITEVNVPPPTEPDGEALYNTNCVSCHGPAGVGGPFGDVVGATANDIAAAIEQVSAMGYLGGELTDSDINAIAMYLDNSTTPPTIPEPQTGEELYNTYCVSCHGAGGIGGPEGDVVGESAEDIAEAIKEESAMGFLADVLSDNDIDAIATYLDNDGHGGGYPDHGGNRGDDDDRRDNDCNRGDDRDRRDHDGNRGDDDDRRNHDANRGNDDDSDQSQCNGNSDGGGRDSSSNRANPFATEEGSQAQNAGGSGGGAMNWLILLASLILLVVRRRRLI